MNVSQKPGAPGVGGRNVVAVLGPTNTGKTHLAIERMLGHASGVIGLPLRLLAREVYNRVVARVGADPVALITGEEKIVPPTPRYRVCTVEAMPSETDAAFLAIDEIQLAGDLERGHVFTDRMLNLRGREETLLLGAATMRGIVEKLLPGVNIVTRPRMSVLAYSGSKKITRLPRRSAVVAFSADEVYAIAELIRRQRGGAAVVLGALSPRTRNAQVETLPVRRRRLSRRHRRHRHGPQPRRRPRRLRRGPEVRRLPVPPALGRRARPDRRPRRPPHARRHLRRHQPGRSVRGRAGRGARGAPFDPVKTVQWRNRELDFSSLDALQASLDRAASPRRPDQGAAVGRRRRRSTCRPRRGGRPRSGRHAASAVALLWDICQVPDYRKIAPANHAELVATLFRFIARDGAISDDWFAGQVAYRRPHRRRHRHARQPHRPHPHLDLCRQSAATGLRDPVHWQERTRAIEDRLSDALHERLTGRFVDRRTSVLMRRLKENAMLEAEITPTGRRPRRGTACRTLDGFRFAPDPSADGPDGKALRAAAQKALAGEIAERAERVATAANSATSSSPPTATLRWHGAAIARVVEGDDR